MNNTLLPSTSVAILDIPIARVGFEDALRLCQNRVAEKKGGYVCFANVHTVTESSKNPALAHALRSAFLSVADGVPLVWVSRWKKQAIPSRVCGPDFTREFLTQNTELPMGLIGGKPGLAQQLAQKFHLKNTVTYSPPMRPFSPENAKDDWENFLKLCPQNNPPAVVWIGLGAPKQELWAKTISEIAPHTLFFAVGAAFDFLTDTKKRAPLWMQKSGLEWSYRLAQEPKRLAGRYFSTNFEFIRKVSLELISKSISPR